MGVVYHWGHFAEINPAAYLFGALFVLHADAFGIAGALLVAYALGGLLLWAERPVSQWLIVIPAAWSLLGTSAAVSFTITEDYGLLAAGVVGGALIALKNRRHLEPVEHAGLTAR
jgi:hypothetical protein